MTAIAKICPYPHEIDDHDETLRMRSVQGVFVGYVQSEGDDMSVRQVGALLKIQDGPIRISDLAKLLTLSKSTVCRITDALEKLEYVQRFRKADDIDGRSVYVRITPKGSAKIGRIMASTHLPSGVVPFPGR